MKIIKSPIVLCPRCYCRFKINKQDIKSKDGINGTFKKFVNCPICENQIELPFRKEELELI